MKFLFLLLGLLTIHSNALDAKTRYLAEPGLYLSDIAKREYKDPTFASVIEKHNNLKAGAIRPGQQINTPRLNKILIREGFPTGLSAVASKLVLAYENVKKSESIMNGSQTPKSRSKLNRALAGLRSARTKLVNKSTPTIPYVMISKVDKVIKGVGGLVRMRTAPSKKQFSWIYKEFSNVFLTGIDWSRERQKYYKKLPLAH